MREPYIKWQNRRERPDSLRNGSLFLAVIIKAAVAEKFLGNEGSADLVGVHAIPSDKGGVTDLAVLFKQRLQVDEGTAVLFRETGTDGTVFVHSLAHGVLAVGLNIEGGEKKHTLHTRLGAAHGKNLGEVLLVFLGKYGLLGKGGGVKLSPNVIDADADGDPIGVECETVPLGTCEKVTAVIARDAKRSLRKDTTSPCRAK